MLLLNAHCRGKKKKSLTYVFIQREMTKPIRLKHFIEYYVITEKKILVIIYTSAAEKLHDDEKEKLELNVGHKYRE